MHRHASPPHPAPDLHVQTAANDITENPSAEYAGLTTDTIRAARAARHGGHLHRTTRPSLVVRMATTASEREAIYRLRYQVYINEMNGADRHQEADGTRRLMSDAWDERAVHFYVEEQRQVVACARLLQRKDGPFECEEQFELPRFVPVFPRRVAMVSRLALHRERRGTHVLKLLTCGMYEFVCQAGMQFVFIDCHTRLLPLYSRLGFRPYRPGFNHAQYTYVVPMVLVVDDLEYLEQVKSPFLPIGRRYPSSVDGRALLLSQFPEAPSVEAGQHHPTSSPDSLLQRLVQDGTRADVLEGLDLEDVRMLASLGHYVPCRPGDAVLRAGDPGRELFLILDGRFKVTGRIRHSDDEEVQVSKILQPGDVFGEIRFLTEEIRYASVVATEAALVLVLNAKALDRLVVTSPKVAAKVFRNIARIVVSRLCPRGGSASV